MIELTQSQSRAVTHRGSNLLVAASAGSGKTEVLARRCVDLIADEQAPCRVDELLVLTFTRAAAAELRVRVARMLRQAAADPACPARRREHLRRQAVMVDAADIGTIDGWCSRVVREHFAEVGVDPAFGILPPDEATILRADVLNEVMEWVYRAEDPLAEAARAWMQRAARPDDGFLREAILAVNGYRGQLVRPEAWLAAQRAMCAGSAEAYEAHQRRLLAEALRRECVLQHEQLALVLDAELGPAAGLLNDYHALLGEWAVRLENAGQLEAVAEEIGALSWRKPRNLEDAAALVFEEVREQWLKRRLKERWSLEALRPVLEAGAATAPLLETLIGLEERLQTRLAAIKRQRAVCEFADVQRLTLELLGEPGPDGELRPTAVARTLQQRYAHILVDEYQDTSPVQVAMLGLVTRPGAGNRFMVGDVKQSIYGFREADARLFARQARELQDHVVAGELQYLSDNFRSHAGVLDGLNALFRALFAPQLGGTAFDEDERLAAARRERELPNVTLDGAPRITVEVCEAARGAAPEDDETALSERVEREAWLVAERIHALLDAGTQVPERRPDGEIELRPLRRRDIVVLLRSVKVNAPRVAGALRDCGLPVVTAGRESLLDVHEVQDVCNVLRLITNRRQDLPLAAYLRGPLVGLDCDELLAIRELTPETDFLTAVEAYVSDGTRAATVERLRGALERLEAWRRAARHLELPALLQRIVREGALESFAEGLAGGTQRVAALAELLRWATEFAASGRQGCAEFVEYLERLGEERLDVGAALGGAEDVIRVMTIHASKGLEFPVVFVMNTGAPFNRSHGGGPVRCDTNLGIGLSFFDYPERQDLVNAAAHCAGEELTARVIEEELRLLYVATTRARELLCITGHTTPDTWAKKRELYGRRALPLVSRLGANDMLSWVLMAAAAVDDEALIAVNVHDSLALRPIERASASTARRAAQLSAEDERWVAEAQRLIDVDASSPLAGLPAVVSVSALKELATHAAEGDQPYVPAVEWPALGSPRFATPETAVDGRVRGTAYHRFLQHAELARLDDAAALSQERARLVAAGQLSPEEAGLLNLDDIAWMGGQPIGRLIMGAAEAVQRELPFVMAVPTGTDDERSIVRGVIDCLVPTSEGLVLVDYKTDRLGDEVRLRERVAMYSVQLRLYAEAARALQDAAVTRAVLVFLHERQVVEVSLAEAPLSALLGSR